MQKKLGAAVLVAASIALTFTGSAQAETNPSCSRVTQIGATKYIKYSGETIASVKQFVGCNRNWGYIYAWDSWHADHRDYTLRTAVQKRNAEFPSGYREGRRGQRELWSEGVDSLDKCTRGYGSVYRGNSYVGGVETEERC